MSTKITNSPTIRDALCAACEKVGCVFKIIKKDVDTQWNSTGELSQSSLDICPALDHLCCDPEFNKSLGVQLRQFLLLDMEWKILGQLSPMLDLGSCFLHFHFSVFTFCTAPDDHVCDQGGFKIGGSTCTQNHSPH